MTDRRLCDDTLTYSLYLSLQPKLAKATDRTIKKYEFKNTAMIIDNH